MMMTKFIKFVRYAKKYGLLLMFNIWIITIEMNAKICVKNVKINVRYNKDQYVYVVSKNFYLIIN